MVLQRCMGGFLAALVLCVWPAALWHDVTTVHRVCPEHGEVVDGAGTGSPECSESAEPIDGAPRVSGSAEHDGEHEHCPFVALGQPSAPASLARTAEVRPVEVREVRPSLDEERHLVVPILLLAPKQSPPG